MIAGPDPSFLKIEFIEYLLELLSRNRDVAENTISDKYVKNMSELTYLENKFPKDFVKRYKANVHAYPRQSDADNAIIASEYRTVMREVMDQLPVDDFVHFTSFIIRKSYTQR